MTPHFLRLQAAAHKGVAEYCYLAGQKKASRHYRSMAGQLKFTARQMEKARV